MDGYGISGIITPQLSFSVPACEYDDTSGLFPAGAQVILTCSNGIDIPRFYISSRSYSGAKLNFTCYDRSYTTDREIAIPDDMYDSDENIEISYLLNMVMAMCGYIGYSDGSGIIGNVITKAKKSDISGKTCRNILDDLSRACCGVWLLQNDTGTGDVRGTLTLIPVDSGFGAVFTAEKYADVYVGGKKSFSKIVVSNGSDSYAVGSSGSTFGTLEIETPYASAALAGALYGRLKDYTYTAWNCNKMLTASFIPSPSSLITFGDKTDMCVNSCTASLTSTGIYAAVSRNAVSEDEMDYHNRTERELIMRYRLGALMGNTRITNNGVQLVVNDKVNNKTKDYGFKMDASGVAEFAGAMVSKMLPTGKFIETSDGECFRANYNGKLYDYSYTEDSDGNISLFRNEVNSGG